MSDSLDGAALDARDGVDGSVAASQAAPSSSRFRAYLFALPWLAPIGSYALRPAVDRSPFAARIGVRCADERLETRATPTERTAS